MLRDLQAQRRGLFLKQAQGVRRRQGAILAAVDVVSFFALGLFAERVGLFLAHVTGIRVPRLDQVERGVAIVVLLAGPALAAQVDRMRSVMERDGMAGKPIYVSDGGWRKDEDLPDPEQQVAFVARWHTILASKGVAGAYWYAWDSERWGTLWDPETGLRPPGKAYGQVYNWLVGATISSCALSKDLSSCPLTRPNGYQGLVIWNASGNKSYNPSKEYKQYRDLMGNTTAIKGPVTIGIKPILLETSAPER